MMVSGFPFYVTVVERVDANTNSRGCNSKRLAVMRGLRLRAEKVASVGEHYTQIVKKKTVCKVRFLASDIGISKVG